MFGAWHRPIRLGVVHTQHPNPSEELGHPIALWLIEEMADCADMALEKVRKKLTGIGIALSSQKWHGAHPRQGHCCHHQNQSYQNTQEQGLG